MGRTGSSVRSSDEAVGPTDPFHFDEGAHRIRQVLEYVPAERLGLSTDCGLINLPRMIAAGKLRALADGAAIVRADLQG